MPLKDKEARKAYNAKMYAEKNRKIVPERVAVSTPYKVCKTYAPIHEEMLTHYAEWDRWKYWKHLRFKIMRDSIGGDLSPSACGT